MITRLPPAPRRIKHRVIGVENEYRLRITQKALKKPKELEFLQDDFVNKERKVVLQSMLPEKLRKRIVYSSRVVLPNQGEYYIDDQNYLEHAGPECLGPYEASKYEAAALVSISQGIKRLRQNFPAYNISLYKTNRNCEYDKGLNMISLESWGMHDNYLSFRRIGFDDLRKYLVPFLRSRWPLIGNAWLGLVDGMLTFLFSQRGEVMYDFLTTITAGAPKPFINTRDEPHADPEIWRRIHDISGNTNMSEWQTFLRLASFDIVLAMIEEKDFLRDPPKVADERCKNLQEISHLFNSDIRFSAALALSNGKRWTALDFQRFYLEEAERYFFKECRGPMTQDRKLGLEFWTTVVDALGRWDIDYLARYLDWAAIWHYFLEPALERAGINPEILLAPYLHGWRSKHGRGVKANMPVETKRGRVKLIDHILQYIVEYANVETEKSPYGILIAKDKMERLFTDEEITEAIKTPPSHTRPSWRETIIEFMIGLGYKVKDWDWTKLTFEKDGKEVQFTNKNPYRFRERMLEKGTIHRYIA